MDAVALAQRGVGHVRNWPGVRHWRRARFWHAFLHDPYARLFDGVYATFDEALCAVPAGVKPSYDSRESIERYLHRVEREEYDYPPLFWIAESFREGCRSVADVGGNIGMKYYAFANYTAYPDDLVWRVIDVPMAVELGRERAKVKDAGGRLQFSDSLNDIEGCDVLFCLGSLQFLPKSLGDLVAGMRRKPQRIIVNTTPIHESRSFFTLHSMGTGICPYRVSSREAFIDDIARAGYLLRDHWLNPNKDMRLPFHPDFDVEHFSGFCFDSIA